jgi:hypothetical protein
MLFFDVKTIHGGTAYYQTRRAWEQQGGAVLQRELRVHADYIYHARELDRRHHQQELQAQVAQGRQPCGPVERRLLEFGRVRGLVYGAYGEASADVHALLAMAAREMAERSWRLMGARSASEMRSLMVSMARRRVGLAAVQAMARHRLARVPYVGATRAVVQAVRDARDQRRQQQQVRGTPAWVYQAQDVYVALARAQGHPGVVA